MAFKGIKLIYIRISVIRVSREFLSKTALFPYILFRDILYAEAGPAYFKLRRPTMNYIGEKIKELRRKNDMTQEKLADFLGVTYQTVSKWETGVTNPDLSLIVPLARLFKVTTDEIFNFKESVEDAKRAELEKMYEETLISGDISKRIPICEEAVKSYPGDMNWLNRYAWIIWCKAIEDNSITDDTKFIAGRERAITLFRQVIENCENDEIKANAIFGIVECLNSKGEHGEAKCYAELYPSTKISASRKEDLLISCMSGEERVVKSQERCLRRANDLLYSIINNIGHGAMTPEARTAAEAIINALIPDGNYLTFHYELYRVALSEAEEKIRAGELDQAMIAMRKARKHAIGLDGVKGDYSFTSPLFDRLKYNTELNWHRTGTRTMLEEFRALFDYPVYSPLKSHKDYDELIKEHATSYQS